MGEGEDVLEKKDHLPLAVDGEAKNLLQQSRDIPLLSTLRLKGQDFCKLSYWIDPFLLFYLCVCVCVYFLR